LKGVKTLKNKHEETPFYTKLLSYAKSNVTSHDVPGHKLGKIENEMLEYAGINMFKLDANAPRGLDNLSKPETVIKKSAELMADAFGADKAYFLTGGTTAGIIASIMSVCGANEKIIMPRNVHKSAINALILSGAIPIFINPKIDVELGIANHISKEKYIDAIDNNMDAKAIFIINPTYFGVTTQIDEIINYAHEKNKIVICDEAHGSHFRFSRKLPKSAMSANADITSCSLHKTLGSLTQSSIILIKGKRIDPIRLRSTINMLQSTSPSSLLLASLDVCRKEAYFNANKKITNVINMKKDAINIINKIAGIKAIEKEHFIANGAFDYDETKLIIKVSELGITGFKAYAELFDNYNIQMELAETNIILAVLSIATTWEDLEKLIFGLKKLSEKYYGINKPLKSRIFNLNPISKIRSRVAYHAPFKYVKFKDAKNQIASEMIMIYPPGIPIVIPGELITDEIIKNLRIYRRFGSIVLSDKSGEYIKIIDMDKWERKDEINEI